jgi:predicted RNA-binding Zn-ribbon protein involved in translation (DUF1610 family)
VLGMLKGNRMTGEMGMRKTEQAVKWECQQNGGTLWRSQRRNVVEVTTVEFTRGNEMIDRSKKCMEKRRCQK